MKRYNWSPVPNIVETNLSQIMVTRTSSKHRRLHLNRLTYLDLVKANWISNIYLHVGERK